MSTSDSDIFAAGDSVSYPSIYNGERIKSQHYVAAQQQGAIAALNMMGKGVVYDYIPYFWTRMFDKSLQYVGYASQFDEVFIDGNLSELKFTAFYFRNNQVVAFAAMNTPNAANIVYEAMRNNIIPSATLIKNGEMTIDSMKQILNKMNSKCSKVGCMCFPNNKI